MFKAGDIVRLKCCPNEKLFILEVVKQTCYAGVEQIWYCGRLFIDGRKYSSGVGRDIQKFSSIEVEAIPEDIEAVKKLKAKLEEIMAKKQKEIDNQDWEAAAKYRDEERGIRNQIELIDGETTL